VKLLFIILNVCLSFLPLASGTSGPQDKSPLDTGVSKIEFENDQIRVLRVSYAPHYKSPMRDYSHQFNVAITPNDLRLSFPDGTSRSIQHAAHDIFWTDPDTHAVENVSDTSALIIEIVFKYSKGPGVQITPAALHSNATGTATDPVPVELEPHHHVVFENQYVRVLDVLFQPGEIALYHTHSLDNLSIQLSDALISQQPLGETWKNQPVKDGDVGFRSATSHPYTHRVGNVGSTPFHVLDIEILP
jgi:hypothetical protein